MEASLAYWCDRLGFEEIWRHGEGHVLLAEVGRDGFHVILDSWSNTLVFWGDAPLDRHRSDESR